MSDDNNSILGILAEIPLGILSWCMVHSFGISLVYPGSIQLLQHGFAPALSAARSTIVIKQGGLRYKLLSNDNNDIDVMYQKSRGPNGNVLVIGCEGNAGFYEIGILSTAQEAGYSTLGWNHPGFGGSTGVPYPDQETNAADVVMQFAVHELGYMFEEIILYGWSIGGYTTTWLAMNYPTVKAVILDATFDNLLPLAIPHMPSVLEPIVTRAVKNFINLDTAGQLIKYPGPIRITRRSQDEVIATTQGLLSTNRGNDLLIKLLQFRYPNVIDYDLLREYLSYDSTKQVKLIAQYAPEEDFMTNLMSSYIEEHSKEFPLMIGESLSDDEKRQLTLFLADKYMADFDSRHCNPLPSRYFSLPWEASTENELVNINKTDLNAGNGV